MCGCVGEREGACKWVEEELGCLLECVSRFPLFARAQGR